MQTLQLPSLDNYVKITELQVNDFRKNGHTLTRNIISAEELAAYREAILEAAEKFNTEKRKIEDRDTYGKAFL